VFVDGPASAECANRFDRDFGRTESGRRSNWRCARC